MNIEYLKWDSEFFGYQIGKVKMKDFHSEQYKKLLEFLKKSAWKLIYVYPLDQISKNTLTAFKIPLVDTKVTFEKLDNFSLKSIKNIKSYDSNDEYEAIEKLALQSGKYSRFKTDINFSNNEFIRLYTEWIKKSISKEIATDIIVYKIDNKIKGIITYKITPDQEIIIGLIAVNKEDHSKGIGKMLMSSLENIAFQKKLKKINVYTQFENKQALAFYQTCGYTIIEQQEIYHLWIQ
jgi:dTDP-4-amino-4,6-dideoxy-D-galactose acyltransferase